MQTKEILALTPETYQVPKGEEHLVHARLEVKKFNSNSGARESIPRIQKFGYKEFKVISHDLKTQGYTVDILHNPEEWKIQQEEEKANAQNKKIEKSKAKQLEAEQAKAQEQQNQITQAVAAALEAERKNNAKEMQKAIDAGVKAAIEAEKAKVAAKPKPEVEKPKPSEVGETGKPNTPQ